MGGLMCFMGIRVQANDSSQPQRQLFSDSDDERMEGESIYNVGKIKEGLADRLCGRPSCTIHFETALNNTNLQLNTCALCCKQP